MTRILATGGALICLAGLLLYGFGTNNPNSLRWLVMALAAALAVGTWAWRGCPLPDDQLTWAIACFVAYAGLSLSWSLDWREGILTFNQLAIMAVLFVAALRIERDTWIKLVSILAVGGVIEHAAISNITPGIFGGLGNENFEAEFLVIIAPLCLLTLVAWRNPVLRWCGPAAALVVLVHAIAFNPSDAKWAAIGGMAGFGWLVLAWRGWYLTAFAIASIGFAAVASAYYGSASVQASVLERFELSFNTLLIWRDNPLFGTGIGSFNYAYPFYQEAYSVRHVVKGVFNFAGAAHNEYVQALAVFGVAGFGLLCLIGYLVFKRRSNDGAAWIGAASLFSFLGASVVGFPAQNPATAFIGIVALSLVVVPQVGFARGLSGVRLSRCPAWLQGSYWRAPLFQRAGME